MPSRTVTTLLVIALLVPMSGCPGASPFALGIWLVHLGTNQNYTALEFFANGTANGFEAGALPIGATGFFIGSLTWSRAGDTVTVLQDTGNAEYTMTATLENATYMEGLRTSTALNQPFTAVKAPSELLQQP